MSSLRTKLVEVEEAEGEAELDPFAIKNLVTLALHTSYDKRLTVMIN